ncbi:hypothetical protein FQR65_LT04770 [Abscondita terminalis]|nr:hypothetical protein FQR65_LT04770 [Abscondita terminalis]
MPGQLEPNENDAQCMFCNSAFSADQKGELWVHCLMCSMWTHNECAGAEKDEYICEWCKWNNLTIKEDLDAAVQENRPKTVDSWTANGTGRHCLAAVSKLDKSSAST